LGGNGNRGNNNNNGNFGGNNNGDFPNDFNFGNRGNNGNRGNRGNNNDNKSLRMQLRVQVRNIMNHPQERIQSGVLTAAYFCKIIGNGARTLTISLNFQNLF